MNFIVLDEWNEASIAFAKNSIKDLVAMYSPSMVDAIDFQLRPPGYYGSSDPMRQLGEIAWKYIGYE